MPETRGPVACLSAPLRRTLWAELAAGTPDGERLERARSLLAVLGRERIDVALEGSLTPGIRIAAALFQAAIELGLDPAGCDAAFHDLGAAQGPFERMDGIGLGRVAHILDAADRRPPPELITQIRSVRGTTERPRWTAPRRARSREPVDIRPIIEAAASEAWHLVQAGHEAAVVERAARLQAGLPQGPLSLLASGPEPRNGPLAEAAQLGVSLAGPGFETARQDDLVHVRIHGGAAGGLLSRAGLDVLTETIVEAEGPIILTGEGSSLLRGVPVDIPESVTDALRATPSVAVLHGMSGDASMLLGRAARSRVAVIGARIGSHPPVPAHRALELELVDAVAHPLSVADAVTSLLEEVADPTAVADLLG